MATYTPKASEIQREWHVVDAEGMVLGRLCTEVARILRGKHKPTFAPHIDTGDHVIIVNADKVVHDLGQGRARRWCTATAATRAASSPSRTPTCSRASRPTPCASSVRGMLPKGPLGRQRSPSCKVYAGPDHPHAAQTPKPLVVAGAKAR